MFVLVLFLMIRRPPRSTLDRSSAASDVYKRQGDECAGGLCLRADAVPASQRPFHAVSGEHDDPASDAVSYTHLRAHETVLDLVCRLLLEQKTTHTHNTHTQYIRENNSKK